MDQIGTITIYLLIFVSEHRVRRVIIAKLHGIAGSEADAELMLWKKLNPVISSETRNEWQHLAVEATWTASPQRLSI